MRQSSLDPEQGGASLHGAELRPKVYQDGEKAPLPSVRVGGLQKVQQTKVWQSRVGVGESVPNLFWLFVQSGRRKRQASDAAVCKHPRADTEVKRGGQPQVSGSLFCFVLLSAIFLLFIFRILSIFPLLFLVFIELKKKQKTCVFVWFKGQPAQVNI